MRYLGTVSPNHLVWLSLQLVEPAPQFPGYAGLCRHHSSVILSHCSSPQWLSVGVVLQRVQPCGKEIIIIR